MTWIRLEMLGGKYITWIWYSILRMPRKIIYTGTRHGGFGVVFSWRGQLTFPRAYYSPYGSVNIDWGNKSSGALQMSLMLLVDILGENNGTRALFAHRRFCDKLISKLPDSWEFSLEELEEIVFKTLAEV